MGFYAWAVRDGDVTPVNVTHTYPGPPPCDTTLQACVDGVIPGDVVEIATNGPIDESLSLNKSLSLIAASNYTPILAEGNSIIATSAGSTDNTFTIQGITLKRGIILIAHGSTGSVTANIYDNTIEESYLYNNAITIRAGNVNPPVMGNIIFSIMDNRITVPEDTGSGQTNAISIQSGNNPKASGTISGNIIEHQGCSQCAAIDLPNGNKELEVYVISNIIFGINYRAGISLHQYSSAGNTNATVINNLITGENGNVGWPGAIVVSCGEGSVNFQIINNTVSNNRRGILIGGRADLGAILNGNVANNIVANHESGISIDNDFTSTVINDHNLLYNNFSNFFTSGPGTIIADPLFISVTDYHLKKGSPAVNSGNNLRLPEEILTDLDNNPRISNSVVDIGAYETKLFPWIIFYPAFIKKM